MNDDGSRRMRRGPAPPAPRVPARLSGLAAAILLLAAASTVLAHPQDGPHADLRFAVRDGGVRLSAGFNLAFIDEIDPLPRELPTAVGPVERRAIEARLIRYFENEVAVAINGQSISPTVESAILFTDPDPEMAALFPVFGMRALIRATVIVDYPLDEPLSTLAITWPTFPPDQVAASAGEQDAAGEPPPMVIEAQVQAKGATKIIRFAEPEPTVVWHIEDADGPRLTPPPPSPVRNPAPMIPLAAIALAALAAGSLAWGVRGMIVGRGGFLPAGFAIVLAASAWFARDLGAVPAPGGPPSVELPSSAAAESIFLTLHNNLYRAFDFTEESDIYDALENSVAADLRETLYEEIYQSLVDAEQGGLLGVITDLEHRGAEIVDVRAHESPDPITASIDVRATWRVTGAVYHWGHSHTRVFEYDAAYRLDAGPDGWRIGDHTLLSQRRVDPGAFPAEL